ncbi:DUF7260 family protein [Halococcus saccharolyticus]|uniref:DUF7260 domain-containing protein n=1 Tax=Halococcus saccharolyticus DSM 5350 TaxID=1227455 RepID=M0MJI3_9EURY|nr:hypothetical protein [Halococcus saccharolyticus]EMA44894.1 hypothetical protein C449_09564 [Halococcus saccharolyticus DSM 5350]
MTVETHVRQALDRVRDEQAVVTEKQTAYGRFVREIEQLSVDTPSGTQATRQATAGQQTTAGSVATMQSSGTGGSDRCERVREQFATTVRPHSTADVDDGETLLEAIAAELSEQVAVALAPQNATVGFTAGIKNGVLSEVTQRRSELRAMERALDREAESLVEATDTLDDVLGWIVEVNETPLTELGFEALRARHDRLDEFREECATVARDRQSVLRATTTGDGEAGIAHQDLAACLYDAFPVAYPILSTVARVIEVCDRCQRAIRAHLVRRV